jgi:hypothetical protein
MELVTIHALWDGSKEMTTSRTQMETALRASVLPSIRQSGFAGSFPHFRRVGHDFIDLLTFQFDRHGGGLVVEVARCPPVGVVTYWGKEIPPKKVTAWDVHPSRRKRVQSYESSGTDGWFRFDRESPQDIVVALLGRLNAPGLWDGLGPVGQPNEQHLPIT